MGNRLALVCLFSLGTPSCFWGFPDEEVDARGNEDTAAEVPSHDSTDSEALTSDLDDGRLDTGELRDGTVDAFADELANEFEGIEALALRVFVRDEYLIGEEGTALGSSSFSNLQNEIAVHVANTHAIDLVFESPTTLRFAHPDGDFLYDFAVGRTGDSTARVSLHRIRSSREFMWAEIALDRGSGLTVRALIESTISSSLELRADRVVPVAMPG